MHKSGSHTPVGNLSSKRGNKNFYKGKGGKKYGKTNEYGARRCPLCRPPLPCSSVCGVAA